MFCNVNWVRYLLFQTSVFRELLSYTVCVFRSNWRTTLRRENLSFFTVWFYKIKFVKIKFCNSSFDNIISLSRSSFFSHFLKCFCIRTFNIRNGNCLMHGNTVVWSTCSCCVFVLLFFFSFIKNNWFSKSIR